MSPKAFVQATPAYVALCGVGFQTGQGALIAITSNFISLERVALTYPTSLMTHR